MAGIYIHIPFCRQACHYCDFHFSTNLSRQAEMVDAICKEMFHRSDYMDEHIDTIYFGGGTPSVLNESELTKILTTCRSIFEINSSAEITLEGNPEDLSLDHLAAIKRSGVNRLSIGVQTFSDHELQWMNRIHSSDDALTAIKNARGIGYENISVDLIYALPNHTLDSWTVHLEKAIDLEPEHISIYGLTIEEKTVFGHRKKKGELIELPEEEAANLYLTTIEVLKAHGYQQYEVSNFSRPGFQSQHNSSYWAGEKYLGVGPGAHSFDGATRQFNVRNNAQYLKAIGSGNSYYEIEELSKVQHMNERILTCLRTSQGIDLQAFDRDFGIDLFKENQSAIELLQTQELIRLHKDQLCLSTAGFLVADEISLKLFFDE